MTTIRWFLFSVIAFVVSIVLTVPAKQGLAWVELDHGINIQGVSGRVLDGHAQHVTINKIVIDQLDWSWRPLALLLGRFSLDWHSNDPEITGKGILIFPLLGQNKIKDATAAISLTALHTLLPIGTTVTGQVNVVIQQLSFDQTITAVDVTLQGHDIEIVTDFGKLTLPKLYLKATGTLTEGFDFSLKDDEKTPTVDLIANYLNGQITLSGDMKASSTIAAQLSAVLPMIAKKQGGKWLIGWKYKL